MAADRYLGDGVYASFDGYQIWLAVNHHENKVIALEPAVFEALAKYESNMRNGEAMRIKLPPPGHVAEQYIDVDHVAEVFKPARINSIPTHDEAVFHAIPALQGNKAVSGIFMVVAMEDERFALFRFRLQAGLVAGQEVWNFGKVK